MKKVAGNLRIDLAQYRELEVITQFSSDLDPETKAQLAQGERIREVLKQDNYNPMSVEHEFISIYAATHKYLIDIELEDIADFEKGLLQFIDEKYPEVPGTIKETGELSKDMEERFVQAIEKFKAEFVKNR